MPQNSSLAVVDDDAMVRQSMASLGRSVGLSVRTYESADAFLAAGDRDFGCLVTDVQMPGTSGLQLQRIVAGWRDPIPTIMMTSRPERVRDVALNGGAICLLTKPIDGDRFVECLETVFGPLD
jgi:FixJ family two-component response regulator